jgi:tRNA1(Val) A37 N6-methylase TrmN6
LSCGRAVVVQAGVDDFPAGGEYLTQNQIFFNPPYFDELNTLSLQKSKIVYHVEKRLFMAVWQDCRQGAPAEIHHKK